MYRPNRNRIPKLAEGLIDSCLKIDLKNRAEIGYIQKKLLEAKQDDIC